MKTAGPAAKVVDLGGRFVMPGFNDAHVHLGSAGQDLLNVRMNGAASVAELQKRLSDAVAKTRPGEWIVGAGWDHTLWPEKKFPNRQQLDEVASKNPVFLTHISGHVAVANSLALRLAGITRSALNPSGGAIQHDAAGAPPGPLQKRAARAPAPSKNPPPTP